jgi:hypothetical protein
MYIIPKIRAGREYKTKGGQTVRIYATDAGGYYPIHGARRCSIEIWEACTWDRLGNYLSGSSADRHDLVEELTSKPTKRKSA